MTSTLSSDTTVRDQTALCLQRFDDPNDPLVRDFFETLAAHEQLLTEKSERNTPAGRTRQKIANKGVHQSLIEWTRGSTETEGFKLVC